jgi:ribosomal-protein-alanine N-acetyltransferase
MQLWSDESVTRLIGGPFDAKRVEQRLCLEIESQRQSQVQYWPIFLRNNDNNDNNNDDTFVGCCGLRVDATHNDMMELGFHLVPSQWRKGLAFEAAVAVVAFATRKLRAVERLFAGHHPDNVASQRLLTKLGFEFTHRQLYEPTGVEHLCYQLKLKR